MYYDITALLQCNIIADVHYCIIAIILYQPFGSLNDFFGQLGVSPAGNKGWRVLEHTLQFLL